MIPPASGRLGRFLSELKRRHVFRVVVGYVVIAWIIIQVAETTFPYLGLSAWAVTAVIVLAIAGIPAAAVLSWMFDITRAGILQTTPLSADAPADAPAPATPRLPVPAGPLIGRETETEEALALLERADVRLLTLTGPAGTGKTRLALELAHAAGPAFGDGARWVPLGAVAQPELTWSAIGQAFGVGEAGTRGVFERLADSLAERDVLLALDNFEHVLAAAPRVGELLAACPRLKILVTSRAPLRVRGEREFPIGPLAPPAPDASPDQLRDAPAVRLFAERAREVEPGFELTRENLPAVAAICGRLDGLPLAIELAAVRVKLLAPAAMLARLEKRLPLLTGGGRDLPTRHRTLREAIAWSHDLLEEPERRLLRRLAVFAGGCEVETAEAVCGHDLDEPTLDLLQSLVDQSLLQKTGPSEAGVRLSSLETIREYAAERLAESGEEEEEIRARHLAHFTALAETAEASLVGSQQREWLGRLEVEHDNFRAALAWALATDHRHEGLRLAGGLWRFWEARGHLSEGRRWLDALLVDAAGVPTKVRLKALYAAGILAEAQGDYDAASACFRESLELNRAAEDRWGVANALNNVGVMALRRGDYDEADRLYRESLELWRELGNEAAHALALNNLANVARLRGEYGEARRLLEESLASHRARGDRNGCALTLGLLADVAAAEGDIEAASGLYQESLELFREVENAPHVARSQLELGRLRLPGDPPAARHRCAESLRLYAELGNPRGVAEAMEALARTAALEGQPERAIGLAAAAAGVRESSGVPLLPAERDELELSLQAAREGVDERRRAELEAEARRQSHREAVHEALAWAGAGADIDHRLTPR